MPEIVFVGNVYAFVLAVILFTLVAVTCHVYLIKVMKSKRFDRKSSILNIILSVILFIIILINFEFNNGKVIEDENPVQENTAVAVNKPMLPEELRIEQSNKRLERMLDEK